MAPRRGGGSFGGGSSVSCSSSAFTSISNQISLGYFVGFLVIDSVLLWMTSRLFKLRRSKPSTRWSLMVSAVLNVFIYAWSLLFLVLGECGATSIDITLKLSLVAGFLSVVATSLLVGVVMVSICKRIHQVANRSPKIVTMVHGLWVAGFAVFYFIATCIFAAISTMQLEFSSYYRDRAVERLTAAWNGVMTFTGVILLLGMLSTALNLVSSMPHCKGLQSNSLRRNVLCLALSAVCFGVFFLADKVVAYRLIWKAASDNGNGYNLAVGFFALEGFTLLFHSVTFLFALLVVKSLALADEVQSVAQEQPIQQQPIYAYPIQSNPPGPHEPLMQQYSQQYPQQSYPHVPPVPPYQQPH